MSIIYNETESLAEPSVVEELKKLPDTYSVINNVFYEFHKPLRAKRNDGWAHSVQIDHVVVGPTGIFLIETKNWSERPISNEDLSSSVEQINHSGQAVFTYLKDTIENGVLRVFNRQSETEKISPKKIILTSCKPNEEFQHIKLLNLYEIKNFIANGLSILDEKETFALMKFFLEDFQDHYTYSIRGPYYKH